MSFRLQNDKRIVDTIITLSAALGNVKKKDINGSSRKRPILIARAVAGNILMRVERFKPARLHQLINRDRASFYHYDRIHDKEYGLWDEYTELYDAVKEAYLGNINTDITKDKMTEIFFNSNIPLKVSEPGFIISFNIGKTKEFIEVDSLDLSDTLDEIRAAFKDYDYDFNIKATRGYARLD